MWVTILVCDDPVPLYLSVSDSVLRVQRLLVVVTEHKPRLSPSS